MNGGTSSKATIGKRITLDLPWRRYLSWYANAFRVLGAAVGERNLVHVFFCSRGKIGA